MKLLRQTAAAVSVSALAVLGLQMSAGAAVPSISASDTTIPAGGSVNVTLGEPCLDSEGELTYGDVISSATSGDTHQETKGAGFIKGATGTFVFDTPGTYTISRFCDGQGLTSQVTITVTAPTTTTTTSTTTTAAPTTSTTTTAPKSTTTTTAPKSTTTTAKVADATATTTTTTAAVKVESLTSTKATGATRVQAESVSYTG
jgi:hypothetical protein